jgi:mannan endo-1,4-beta-mannosidase
MAKIAPRKTLWINKVGSSDRGGDKAAWITNFVKFLTTAASGLIWFEADKPGEPDWRLSSTPQTTAAAKAAVAGW